jgi:predicted  nucleic acid-binding Zn-ribbon protein
MAETSKMKLFTYENLLQYDPLIKSYVDTAVATGDAESIKTVALEGNTLKFYRVKEPVGSTAPVYTLTLPETDISGLMQKLSAATSGNLVMVAEDGANVADAGIKAADVALKSEVEAAKSALQTNIDANKGAIDTLVGTDTGKSARTIANEELAKQLIPEGAKESLNTLEEIAAWIQAHPDDASAMNKAISDLEALVGTLPEGITATTVVGYIDEVKAALTSAIATAKSEAISDAAADATEKANKALSDAKSYADAEVAKDRARLDADEADIDALQAAIGEGGSVTLAIAEAKKAGTDAQADVDALELRVDDTESEISTIKSDATALTGRVSTLETKVATAEGTIASNTDRIKAVEDSIGTVPDGSTVMGIIRDIQESAYDDTAVRALIKTNADDIDALEGRMATAEGNISANASNITANGDRITALEGKVGEGFEAIPEAEIQALFA